MRVRSTVMALGALGVCGLVAGIWLQPAAETAPTPVEVLPDRFVEVEPAVEERAAAPTPEQRNPDAGEGARAAREVSGELGTVGNAGDLQVGGLIGTQGTAIGSGALGARGSGLGGGGTAEGLGGLGTKGLGSGRSGYGSGGGSFGAAPTSGLYTPPAPLSKDWNHPGYNPTELVERDHLSTFSIDVDTASYTQARRQIRGGQVPAAASVRTEEFVNYFRYDYPEPETGRPFSITMDGAAHPWRAGHHVMRVGIQGARDHERARTPVHLTFLVDVSGSMRSADKLPLAKQALHHLVDHLEEGDTVAIATYAAGTSVVLHPSDAGSPRAIHAAIDALHSGGGTAMGTGMQLAYEMALKTSVEGEENRVIVLSDGDANIGASSHEQILDQIAGYAKKGITLSTVGLGTGNYRDALMEQLADKGDGNYSYVDSLEEAKRVFGEDLGATLRTIARDVKIQVEFDPDNVLAYKLIGYENREIADEDFRDDAVDAGEVGAGHTVTALYDLVLRDHASGSLATVRVRHKEPGPDAAAAETAVELPARAVTTALDKSSRDLRRGFAAASFAEKLRGARELDEVSYAEIARLFRGARRPRDERDAELLGLIEAVGASQDRDPVSAVVAADAG